MHHLGLLSVVYTVSVRDDFGNLSGMHVKGNWESSPGVHAILSILRAILMYFGITNQSRTYKTQQNITFTLQGMKI